MPLAQNLHNTTGRVNDGTYIAFMVLQALGFILAWALSDSKYIKRKDGSKVIVMKNPTWLSETKGLYETLKTDYFIILLFPMFLSSNWFTVYQFNAVNGFYFDVATRSLNSLLYWLCQMIGAYTFGLLLDLKWFSRTMRAKFNWVLLFMLTFAIWGGGYAWQRKYERDDPKPEMRFSDSGYVGPMFLYMFYGFYDAAYQTCTYWYVSFPRQLLELCANQLCRYMGALSNNSRKLAHYAGFYKGIQSAGAAITWR